jgi:hypothetical protein
VLAVGIFIDDFRNFLECLSLETKLADPREKMLKNEVSYNVVPRRY